MLLVLKVAKIHEHATFRAIPFMRSLANARKPLQMDGRTDRHAANWSRLVGWTNRLMYKWKECISGFGRTDGWTDGQTENIKRPMPICGGITKGRVLQIILINILYVAILLNIWFKYATQHTTVNDNLSHRGPVTQYCGCSILCKTLYFSLWKNSPQI